MAESSRRGGGKGKSIVPPARNFSPLNNQDLDFLFDDDDENTLQDVDVQPHYQQSQGTQGNGALRLVPAGNSKEQCTSWFEIDCKMF
ncbi:hypothetical protein F511_18473 [Dorcoceras hygrometricum]|uniref:Uncharacterized protein n=1 Tax=Dorcoceras hygrometricum TaxID=472368 RepID=A0A2Z7DKJ2_9LAMI|nr:hypothetical protein F511_18473 [Dorcoceras hygrometricum]